MPEEMVGNYRLVKCLMIGQTSQVWEVVEASSQRHFALKMLLPDKANQPELRKNIFHEASVGKELTHPNVIKIAYVSPTKEEVPYFVMEFFPAGSVKHRLMQKQLDFVKERAHSILKQAATALAYMNASGWVHRDVKPDNMLVNSSGELRLIDFALAQRIRGASFFTSLSKMLSGKTQVQGTRSYMSPEQIRGEPLDGRSDVYCFGASAYEIVTQRPPFRGQSNQELLKKHIVEKPASPVMYNPDVTEEFAKLVLHMLEKKREDRPESFHDVLKALNSLRVFKSDPFRTK